MVLDSSFPPDPRVENEALALIEQGHSVYLYCFDYSQKLAEYEVIKGIHVCRFRLPKYFYSLSALAYTVPFFHFYFKKSLSKFITKYKIDTLHIHDMQIARSVFNVNKKYNLPTVLDLHENRPEIMKYYTHVNSFLGKLLISPSIWKKFEYKYIKKAHRVIVVTEAAKEYYMKEIPVKGDKIYAVPNTVRKEFYTKHDIKKEISDKYTNHFTLLYLGETGIRRGILTMIKSLKYIIPVIPNIKLVIVGKSKVDHVYEDLINELGYQNYVDLEGWQNFETFQSYILGSDIGVCPIHKNIHHETTYANKIFQYLAFGKPIVVSDCKAQADIAEKYTCGLVFNDQDAKDFADKIIVLHDDKELYQKFSDNGIQAIQEKLNWEKISSELTKLYQEI